jgi:lysophospholipid acyltransferase (LPLAT)-like uncharacterized protein
MIEPQRVAPQSPFSLGFKHKCILFPFGLLYRLWVRTIRFKFSDSASQQEIERNQYPVIITLWHNRLFLEAFYGWSGIYSVRGSSSRGGTKAIRDLVRKLKDGHDIGITPDGSRGPCYRAKAGGILVAKLSKVPLLLVTFEYGRHFQLNSWDRFVIPFPFSTVLVRTHLVSAVDLLNHGSIEDAAGELSQQLMKLTFD